MANIMPNNIGSDVACDCAGDCSLSKCHHDHHCHHHHSHSHHECKPQLNQNGDIFCLCGGRMNKGKIKEGAVKCIHPKCQKELTGLVCYYCPLGSIQEHRNGFFLCQSCAENVRNGKDIQFEEPVPQTLSVNGRKRKRSIPSRIMKQGYMNKRGSFLKRSVKKSWFKLCENKKLSYFSEKFALHQDGQIDLSQCQNVTRDGQHGVKVITKRRVYSFLLHSAFDRDEWYDAFMYVLLGIDNVKANQDSDHEVSLIEDDIDHSFIEEHNERFDDFVPPAAYSCPATPYTPPADEMDHFAFPDTDEQLPEQEGPMNLH